jgi:hypothetical protein
MLALAMDEKYKGLHVSALSKMQGIHSISYTFAPARK